MPLAPGTKLGPYEIQSLLGKGGMGEVYKATDTRLHRAIALKLLPEEFLTDRPRRDRFETEAKAVAALNHPNIVALHDIAQADGHLFTISELIEGDTLTTQTLPLKKVLDVAAQIADGLAAAHAKGITHRDLKPDNVMLTRDGRAKILDFGLAQITRKTSADTETAAGTIMGTAAYMSPEQVRGEPIDTRSDIFSFGALLYELLAHRRAFDAPTPVEAMNSILNKDPEDLPADIPPYIQSITRTCLEKQKEQRFQSAKDLAFALRQTNTTTVLKPQPAKRKWLLPVGLTATLATAAALLIPQTDPLETIRLTQITSDGAENYGPVFSPDGRSIAFTKFRGGTTELLVQALDALQPTVLAKELTLIHTPQWTADGTRICYRASAALQCVSAAGGRPQRLLEKVGSPLPPLFTRDGKSVLFVRIGDGKAVLFASTPPGAPPQPLAHVEFPQEFTALSTWTLSPDGKQLAVTSGDRLSIVPLAGGRPAVLEVSPGRSAKAPVWFPDSRHLVVSSAAVPVQYSSSLVLVDVRGPSRRLLLPDQGPVMTTALSPDGQRIVYSSGRTDWHTVEHTLDGRRVRQITPGAFGEWSPAGDRVLLGNGRSLTIVDADGSNPLSLTKTATALAHFSPDGKRIAYTIRGSQALEAIPAAGGIPVRIHSGRVDNHCWSPEGDWIWFLDGGNLRKVPSQGGAAITVKESRGRALGCSPDGSIAYVALAPGGVRLLAPDGKQDRQLKGVASLQSFAFGDRGNDLYFINTNRRIIGVVDTRTGAIRREIPVELDANDEVRGVNIHPDGKRLLLTTGGLRYDLWMAEGFAQPATGWKSWFRHWEIPPAPPITESANLSEN